MLTGRHARFVRGGLAFIVLLVGFGPAAHACYRVHLNNQSNHKVEVIWTAWGCAGMTTGKTRVCHSTSADPGQSVSYSFGWSKLGPTVTVRDHDKPYHGKTYADWVFTHHGSKFKHSEAASSSPKDCSKKDYYISFREEHWNQK